MATAQEAVRRLKIETTESGTQKTTDSVKGLAKAIGDVTVAQQGHERAAQSAERRLDSVQRRYDQAYRAQKELAKVERDLTAARAQGLITDARKGELMQQAIRYHNSAAGAATLHGRALQELSQSAVGVAGSAGVLGRAFPALGPGGIALAATVGAVVIGFKQMADGALHMAEQAGKLRDFSETTGFTVQQLQALTHAGSQVGVSADSVNKALEMFSVKMDDVKERTGPLYDNLLRINPALAEQVSNTHDLSEAWDLVSKAVKDASTTQANALARSAFGRSGVEITRLLRANADAGGLSGLISQLREADQITAAQAARWDDLGDTINENMRLAKQNILAAFTGPVLEAINWIAERMLEMSRWAREIGEGLSNAMGGSRPPTAAITVEPNDAAKAEAERRRNAIAAYNDMKRWMDILGDAATNAEKVKLKQLELDAAIAKTGVSQEYANRAFSIQGGNVV